MEGRGGREAQKSIETARGGLPSSNFSSSFVSQRKSCHFELKTNKNKRDHISFFELANLQYYVTAHSSMEAVHGNLRSSSSDFYEAITFTLKIHRSN
jgi:hypothetical protein